MLKISPRTAQLNLEELENKGVLESKSKGKIKLFKLLISDNSKRYLILTEEYKTITYLENNPKINELINKLKPNINGIGLIFGSYANNTQNNQSDLDILIIGSYDNKEVNYLSKIFSIKISIKHYTNFDDLQKNTIFLGEVLMNHIIFSSAELFIDSFVKNE